MGDYGFDDREKFEALTAGVSNPVDEACQATHQLFEGFLRAGFTEDQAIRLCAATIVENTREQ